MRIRIRMRIHGRSITTRIGSLPQSSSSPPSTSSPLTLREVLQDLRVVLLLTSTRGT